MPSEFNTAREHPSALFQLGTEVEKGPLHPRTAVLHTRPSVLRFDIKLGECI